jgi:hypothetical protein
MHVTNPPAPPVLGMLYEHAQGSPVRNVIFLGHIWQWAPIAQRHINRGEVAGARDPTITVLQDFPQTLDGPIP